MNNDDVLALFRKKKTLPGSSIALEGNKVSMEQVIKMISDMVVVDIVVIIVVIQNFRCIFIDALRNNLDEIDFIQAAVLSLHIGFESE